MKVLFVTSEAYPLVKTGGLGDIANSLPKALNKAGVDVRIVLPSYKHINAQIRNKRPAKYIGQHFGFGDCHLVLGEMPDSDVPVWLINCPEAFERHGVGPYESSYGADWGDNYRRFALLSKVAEIISYGEIDNWKPDVVHCQDWQSGLAPVYIKYSNMENKPKTVFTIHNLKYMGCFGNHIPYEVGVHPEVNGINGAELYGHFSYLKAGIVYSDVTTTVSPTYAREITTAMGGYELSGVLKRKENEGCLKGILNGIVIEEWDPNTNGNAFVKFSADDITNKTKNKLALQEMLGLTQDVDAPIICSTSRIVEQKGMDVFAKTIDNLVDRGVQVVVLGNGDPFLESLLKEYEHKHKGQVCVYIGFDEALEHKVYAGSDIFMAASRYEPCGLAQMKAMAYGCVPVVRRVGGLADTVHDVTVGGAGFTFDGLNDYELFHSISRAVDCFYDAKGYWASLVEDNMRKDFSWHHVVQDYIDLYNR